MKLPWRQLFAAWCAPWLLLVLGGSQAAAQDLNLSPTRPTIANSATVQSPGVLQVEIGFDSFPQTRPSELETLAANFYYTPYARLRLDFGVAPYTLQRGGGQTTQGVGTVTLGGKVELRKEHYHRAAPGVAVQYGAELPAASQDGLQNYGQQAILLLNHHYGKEGDLDILINGSIVQAGCQLPTGCSYGGQQSLAFSYHLQKTTRLYGEVYGQNNSSSNTPPGTYVFGGFYHQFSDAFGIDGGVRFGVSDHSSRVGGTVGLVFGKRLRAGPSSR